MRSSRGRKRQEETCAVWGSKLQHVPLPSPPPSPPPSSPASQVPVGWWHHSPASWGHHPTEKSPPQTSGQLVERQGGRREDGGTVLEEGDSEGLSKGLRGWKGGMEGGSGEGGQQCKGPGAGTGLPGNLVGQVGAGRRGQGQGSPRNLPDKNRRVFSSV